MSSCRAAVACPILLVLLAGAGPARPTTVPSADSPGGLSVHLESVQTCDGLGRCQGAAEHDGFLWLYGDAQPNGVIRQYWVDRGPRGDAPPQVRYTGLQIDLTYNGINLINHPTGLTWNPEFGCYLGNTITATKTGTIYHLDWPRMLIDRNLDHAVLAAINDDLAVQGCRPEFVRHGDRWLLATADYGHDRNAVRLYDPVRLETARKTSGPGVLVASYPCGPFVQQLHWVDSHGLLVVVQNQVEGRRWRLVPADLWATADLRVLPPYDALPRPDELEGFSLLDPTHCVLVTSGRKDNVTIGRITLPAALPDRAATAAGPAPEPPGSVPGAGVRN